MTTPLGHAFSQRGLASAEAATRLAALGRNEISREKASSPWRLLAQQFEIVFGELFRSFASRSVTRVFWEVGVFSNVTLLGVVAASALVQLGIHHIPATEALFQIGTLSLEDCVISVGVGLVPVTVVEVTKLIRRPRGYSRQPHRTTPRFDSTPRRAAFARG